MARTFVYFVRSLHGGPVKIGCTSGLAARLSYLQTGNPYPLALLAAYPGAEAEERAEHERFRFVRLRGEWFKDSPELMAYIESLPTYRRPVAVVSESAAIVKSTGALAMASWLRRNCLSQSRLGTMLGMQQPTISAWLRGVCTPSLHARALICDLTQGEVVWSEPVRAVHKRQPVALAGNTALAAWMARNDKSQTWLAKQVGASQSLVSKWARGASVPMPWRCAKITDITNGEVRWQEAK